MAYFGQTKLRLGEILVQAGLLTNETLEDALSKKGTMKIGEYLVENSIVSEDDIAKAMAEKLGYELVDLRLVEVPEDILNLVDLKTLKKDRVIPIGYSAGNMNILRLAMADPTDINAIDDISIITGCQIDPVVSTPRAVMLALDRYYGSEEINAKLDEYAKERLIHEEEDIYDEDINSSPIVLLVKEMIDKAARQRASDIHIEALEREVRVRYRIDGALYERARYNIKILPAIVARVKIISGMDISEKRKPQDGRITQIVDRVEYDIRVSALPSVYGEKIVMRLAAKKALNREKSQLGLKPNEMKQFDHIIKNPHGILLVTGPTGSGKSTTLYTALSELNTEDVNIITVEDPVEANIDGINQVQVNPKANLTFATALRSILRQDPDIIMIGEIRDQETAGIAVQASITGHLVVSTLHTNSSASTITRLEDMGIEAYLIADSVVGVIAQRLVRRLCPECRKPRIATPEECDILGADPKVQHIIYDPRIRDVEHPCTRCDSMGYKGRIGVYEIMEMTPELKALISRGGNADEIKQLALSQGMHTLRMSASEYVLDGTTSFDEMMKVSFDS